MGPFKQSTILHSIGHPRKEDKTAGMPLYRKADLELLNGMCSAWCLLRNRALIGATAECMKKNSLRRRALVTDLPVRSPLLQTLMLRKSRKKSQQEN